MLERERGGGHLSHLCQSSTWIFRRSVFEGLWPQAGLWRCSRPPLLKLFNMLLTAPNLHSHPFSTMPVRRVTVNLPAGWNYASASSGSNECQMISCLCCWKFLFPVQFLIFITYARRHCPAFNMITFLYVTNECPFRKHIIHSATTCHVSMSTSKENNHHIAITSAMYLITHAVSSTGSGASSHPSNLHLSS